jgi:methylated-DNA-protein-cysteine methyltransferase related protein
MCSEIEDTRCGAGKPGHRIERYDDYSLLASCSAENGGDTGPMTRAENAIMQAIFSIPEGKVASYGQVAAAAGYPRHHRQVAQFLRKYGSHVPWQRVVGAGGVLKTSDEGAMHQRLLLEREGVRFNGDRINLARYGCSFE